MLGFGGDDEKERLKENMEEIKNIINREGQNDLQPPAAAGSGEEPADSGTDFEDAFDQPGGVQDDLGDEFSTEPDSAVEQADEFPEEPDAEPSSAGADAAPLEESSRAPVEPPHGDRGREEGAEAAPEPGHEPRQQRPGGIERDIPEPAETRELEVPEIDKGPLFIRRQKFRRALEMIDEMFYIRNEIEETVNRLESGIQRDRETEKELRELMQGFESNRGEVEEIVSPGEE